MNFKCSITLIKYELAPVDEQILQRMEKKNHDLRMQMRMIPTNLPLNVL